MIGSIGDGLVGGHTPGGTRFSVAGLQRAREKVPFSTTRCCMAAITRCGHDHLHEPGEATAIRRTHSEHSLEVPCPGRAAASLRF